MSYTVSASQNTAIRQKLEQKFGTNGANQVLSRLQQPENAEELAVLEKLPPEQLDQFFSTQPGNAGNAGNAGDLGGNSFVDSFLGYLDSLAAQWFGSPAQNSYTGFWGIPQWVVSGASQPATVAPAQQPAAPPQAQIPLPPPPPPAQQSAEPAQIPQPQAAAGDDNGQGNTDTRNGQLFGGINDDFSMFGMPNGFQDITSGVSGLQFV